MPHRPCIRWQHLQPWLTTVSRLLFYMPSISRALISALLLLAMIAGPGVLADDNKHVLLLHSFGTEMRPWSDYAQGIRQELNRQSPWPLTITDQSVVSARYDTNSSEKRFADYLAALFAQHPPAVIISVGAPAAAFVQRNRGQLFASTPMVLTTLEERRIQYSDLTQDDAVIPIQIDYKAVIANILKILPDTRQSRLRKSEQGNKWSFCLTAGKIGPRIRRDDDETRTPEPHTGFQGEGGAGRCQGRPNDSSIGRAL